MVANSISIGPAISSNFQPSFAQQVRDIRSLAAYPECAVLLEETERQTCCDGKCVSDGCREFCYNDITHPVDAFEECEGLLGVQLHDCCDSWAGGNQWSKFDCASELIKGDCQTEAECDENYNESLKEYEDDLAVRADSQTEEDDTNVWEEAWFIILIILIIPGIIAVVIIILCVKRSKNKNKAVQPTQKTNPRDANTTDVALAGANKTEHDLSGMKQDQSNNDLQQRDKMKDSRKKRRKSRNKAVKEEGTIDNGGIDTSTRPGGGEERDNDLKRRNDMILDDIERYQRPEGETL